VGLLLSDNETKVDLLNNEPIARTIVTLLREKADRAVTIGVHGDWGAGKSSVLEMIEDALSGEQRVVCIKFNGWRFQGFEDAKIALLEGIVDELVKQRSGLTKATEAVKETVKRIDWLKVARHAGGLAITAATGLPSPDVIGGVVSLMKGVLSDPKSVINRDSYEQALDGVQGLFRDAPSTNVPAEVEAFRAAFKDLLAKADVDQLVVPIDDLDRCLPETAVETLEAVRLFVFTDNTAFVVAADEAMIEYAVRKHFPDLPDTTGPRDYARNYLEKLIQVPFRIPALGETETRIYVTLLLIGAEIGEDAVAFNNLIKIARDALKTPWKANGLSAEAVKTALGSQFPMAANALTLSDQVGPLLAAGTQGNPRQIKRFLNALLLRHATAVARGFGTEVALPALAKLMLVERFIPHLFDQIASTAAADPDGHCNELAALEQHVRSEATTAKGAQKKSVDRDEEEDTALLSEWKAADTIASWARLNPPIGTLDLRPYLFVAKDRKDYFGPASALGRLAAVVEQLMGPKMAVQALEGDLRQLVPAEAAQVFEALRGRVMASSDFAKQPSGVDGMQVLLRTHPSIQASAMDMLEAMPAAKTGPWAAVGWEGYLSDPVAKARFEATLTTWSKSGSRALQTAATAALRVKARG
jgi:predicted KAP-like P-loop ATPase